MHTAIATISSPSPRSCSLSALEQQDPLSASSSTFIHTSSASSCTSFSSFSSSHLLFTRSSPPLITNNSNKRKKSFHLSFCPTCKHPRPIIMAIAEPSRVSHHGSVERPRRSQHQHHHHPSSTLSTPPQQQEQHSSMLTSLHLLPNPYATYDSVSGPHQIAVGLFLQPCMGLPQIDFETDYRLFRSPRAVAMTVPAMSSLSVKTANVGNSIDGPISIYNLTQSRRRLYLRSSFSPSPSPSPSFPSPHLCTRLNNNNNNNNNNKRYKTVHAHKCSLDGVRSRARRCQVSQLWLNSDASQEQQLLMDYPSGDYQSMESTEEDAEEVEEEVVVVDKKELNLKFALEEIEVALDKTLFPRSRSGIDWCLSSSTIATFVRASRTKGDPSPLCAHAAAATAASDVTPDRRTTYAAAVALFKHDDNNISKEELYPFGLGVVPSLTSSSSPFASSQPPCCHTCTATPTTALSPLPYASTTTTITPSTPLPPLGFPSATLFLDLSLPSSSSSLLSATTSLDANLRSPSPEKPNRSTTIDEATSSSPFCSPSLTPSFILSPPTSILLASASSLPTPSTTTTTTTNKTTATTGGFNLNDCKGFLDAPANSVTTSSIALNYSSSFTNSTTFSNTTKLSPPPPAEQRLTNPEPFRLRCHSSIPSSMCQINPASCTPESLFSSFSVSSAAMSSPSSSNPGQMFLNQNGEPTGDCHHVSSRVAAGCDHDRSDSDSSVDLDLADRNGTSAIQHQERVDNSGMVSTNEMRLRGEIMARISPMATMMSRTPPTLPEVPVWNEPVAHQIRRVQSAHMAELHRQWEAQQQQRRQAQIQDQQQQSLHQHHRYNSYPPVQRSASMSRYVSVAMERTPPAPMHRSTASFDTAAAETQLRADETQLRADEETRQRTLARGSNSLYLNYEGGVLRPEEQWRRGEDDMVGR
ncbi:MAG: hypothetical protein JOS17DRAFT_16718 [Linnemannia elongata]|nr:MAG: hypothetical protein JOS17DRAFT_16718 [Linnemannia elongata]